MATVDVQVGASTDDAWQEKTDGTMWLDGTVILLQDDNRIAGFRWTSVNIPSGATVTTAYISLYLPDDSDDFFDNKTVYCENASNPGTFTTDDNNITGRTKTSNSVALGSGGQGTGWKNSPSLVTPVQEVVTDQGGTGDAFVVILDSTGSEDLEFRTWDYSGNAHGPKLYIEYTPAAAGVPTQMMYYQRRRRV